MTQDTMPDTASLMNASIKVPQHVVYRSFPSETVVLNLETGKYHGLNATAGRMLEELERAPSFAKALAAITAGYEQPGAVLERDLRELCGVLHERGLIEIEDRAN
jgi:Coenzyme PQQ synthesis protein D (PqqD)